MAEIHTASFRQLRDLVIDGLTDDDRRCLTTLFGSMTDRRREPLSLGVVSVIRAFAALGPDDRSRTIHWFSAYCTQFGQIPQAASRRVPTQQAGIAPVERPPRTEA